MEMSVDGREEGKESKKAAGELRKAGEQGRVRHPGSFCGWIMEVWGLTLHLGGAGLSLSRREAGSERSWAQLSQTRHSGEAPWWL